MKTALISLLLCSVAQSTFAMSDLIGNVKETSDKSVAYDPHNRVPLTISRNSVVVITFDPMESIEQVVKTSTAPFTYPCEAPDMDKKQECDSTYTNNLPLIGRSLGTGDLVVLTRGAVPNDKERAYLFAVTVVDGELNTVR